MKKIIFTVIISVILLSVCMSVYVTAEEGIVSDEGRLPFADVKKEYWYFDGAAFCYANGIMKGMNSYTFAPAGKLTRAQFVTVLANFEGVDTSTYKVTKFKDVKELHWCYGAVAWAYSEGITAGTSPDKFSPNLELNRQTLSRMLMLYMKSKGYDVTVNVDALAPYTDKAAISSWAVDGMEYIVSAGLIQGMTDDSIAPLNGVTRAQVARIMMLFGKKYFYTECDHFFESATCTEAEHCVYCGLKNGIPNGHIVDVTYNCVTEGECIICHSTVGKSKLIHDFAPATCSNPAKCRDCNITRGEATGKHSWTSATCTENGKCRNCGIIGSMALGHDSIAATCTTPAKCRRCGVNVSSALGHSFGPASCTQARVCKRCGILSGKALGHDIVNQICTRCNYTTMTDPVKKTLHYIKVKGLPMYLNGKVTARGLISGIEENSRRDPGTCYLYYDFDVPEVVIRSNYYRGNMYPVYLHLYIPEKADSYRYWMTYHGADGSIMASAWGTIKASSVYEGMTFIPANYSGPASLKSEFNYYAYDCLIQGLKAADYLMENYCDGDITDFGFKYIK